MLYVYPVYRTAVIQNSLSLSLSLSPALHLLTLSPSLCLFPSVPSYSYILQVSAHWIAIKLLSLERA